MTTAIDTVFDLTCRPNPDEVQTKYILDGIFDALADLLYGVHEGDFTTAQWAERILDLEFTF